MKNKKSQRKAKKSSSKGRQSRSSSGAENLSNKVDRRVTAPGALDYEQMFAKDVKDELQRDKRKHVLKEIGGGNSMNTEGVGLKGVGSAVFVDKCVQTIQVFESDEEWIGSEQGASDREADLMAKEAEQLLNDKQVLSLEVLQLQQQNEFLEFELEHAHNELESLRRRTFLSSSCYNTTNEEFTLVSSLASSLQRMLANGTRVVNSAF